MPARIKTRRRPDRLAGLLRIRSSGFLRVSRRWRCQSRSCVPVGAIRGAGDTRAIRESLERNGQYRPIVVNRRTMEVLAGNHTLAAALELGWDGARGRRLWMSMTSRRSGSCWSITAAMTSPATTAALLAELLEELPDLDGTGYDLASLDELLEELGRPAFADEDELPATPPKPRTRPGEVIELGRHRLVCGDARDAGAYERLLGAEQARLLWTDPPYGVSYTGKTERAAPDRKRRSRRSRGAARGRVRARGAALAAGPRLYVAHPAGAAVAHVWQRFCGPGLAAAPDARLGQGRARARARRLPLPPRADPVRLQAGRGTPRPRRQRLVWRQHPDVGARGRAPARLARAPDDEPPGADRDRAHATQASAAISCSTRSPVPARP